MNPTFKTILQFFLFLGIGGGILYWLYLSQENSFQIYCANNNIAPEDCSLSQKLITDFSQAKWIWIFVAVCLYNISNISRTLRWQMMLKTIGHPTKFATAFIAVTLGYFTNSLLPRSGEILRPSYITFTNKAPLEKVFGTIAAERAIDLFCLALVIVLGFIIEYEILYNYISKEANNPFEKLLANPITWVVGILGILGVITLFIFRKKLKEKKIYRFFEEKIKGFWEGIISIKKVEKPGVFLFHSINIWMMYYLMTYISFLAFAPTENLSLATGLIVFVFGTLGILIPSPGGIGAYQVLVTTCLFQFYNLEQGDAFSFSNIAFWPIYFSNILLGLMILPFVMKFLKKKPQVETTKST